MGPKPLVPPRSVGRIDGDSRAVRPTRPPTSGPLRVQNSTKPAKEKTMFQRSCLFAAMLIFGAGLAAWSADAPTPVRWNVIDAGAVADGTTDCTAAFQKALDAAGNAGRWDCRSAGRAVPLRRHAVDPRGASRSRVLIEFRPRDRT